jgi:hypothetical protein
MRERERDIAHGVRGSIDECEGLLDLLFGRLGSALVRHLLLARLHHHYGVQ